MIESKIIENVLYVGGTQIGIPLSLKYNDLSQSEWDLFFKHVREQQKENEALRAENEELKRANKAHVALSKINEKTVNKIKADAIREALSCVINSYDWDWKAIPSTDLQGMLFEYADKIERGE